MAKNPVLPVRMATASGRGIGKTTLVAWIAIWILCTRPRSQGTVTADSWQQLRDRTWTTIQHWLKLSLFRDWFVVTSDRIHFRSQKESWFLTAQSSKPENAQAFGGQHAATSTSYVIFDEASGIPGSDFRSLRGFAVRRRGNGLHVRQSYTHRRRFPSRRLRQRTSSLDSCFHRLP